MRHNAEPWSSTMRHNTEPWSSTMRYNAEPWSSTMRHNAEPWSSTMRHNAEPWSRAMHSAGSWSHAMLHSAGSTHKFLYKKSPCALPHSMVQRFAAKSGTTHICLYFSKLTTKFEKIIEHESRNLDGIVCRRKKNQS
jgi:hypothetical protein